MSKGHQQKIATGLMKPVTQPLTYFERRREMNVQEKLIEQKKKEAEVKMQEKLKLQQTSGANEKKIAHGRSGLAMAGGISLGKRLGLKLTGDSGEATKKTRIDMFRAMTGYVPPEEKEVEQPVEFPFFTGVQKVAIDADNAPKVAEESDDASSSDDDDSNDSDQLEGVALAEKPDSDDDEAPGVSNKELSVRAPVIMTSTFASQLQAAGNKLEAPGQVPSLMNFTAQPGIPGHLPPPPPSGEHSSADASDNQWKMYGGYGASGGPPPPPPFMTPPNGGPSQGQGPPPFPPYQQSGPGFSPYHPYNSNMPAPPPPPGQPGYNEGPPHPPPPPGSSGQPPMPMYRPPGGDQGPDDQHDSYFPGYDGMHGHLGPPGMRPGFDGRGRPPGPGFGGPPSHGPPGGRGFRPGFDGPHRPPGPPGPPGFRPRFDGPPGFRPRFDGPPRPPGPPGHMREFDGPPGMHGPPGMRPPFRGPPPPGMFDQPQHGWGEWQESGDGGYEEQPHWPPPPPQQHHGGNGWNREGDAWNSAPPNDWNAPPSNDEEYDPMNPSADNDDEEEDRRISDM